MTIDPTFIDISGYLDRKHRHCRWCDRELLLKNGQEPRVWMFKPRPDIVHDTENRLYDDNRWRRTPYVYCNEDHRERFYRMRKSWENA